MILFLDFDGVLHPAPPYNRNVGVFCHLERFESLMRDFPDWHIVISSSWREQFSMDTMRGFFSDDIALRIIGITPRVLPGPFQKQREIMQYLEGVALESPCWVVVDDQAEEFAPQMAGLVICKGELGLDQAAELRLRKALRLQ